MPTFAPPLVDDFTGSNGTINGRTNGALHWTSPVFTGGNTVDIGTNAAAGNAAGGGDAIIDNIVYGPNIRASVVISALPTTSDWVGIVLRHQQTSFPATYGVGTNYYTFRANIVSGSGNNDTVTAIQVIDGTGVTLTTTSGSNTGFEWVAGDVFGIEIVELPSSGGTWITALRNGVALCSWIDTNASRAAAGGRCGIEFNDSTGRIDDLKLETMASSLPTGTQAARFALEDGTDTPAVSPSATLGYAWGKTSLIERRILIPKSQEIASTIATKSYAMLGTNPSDTIARQYISAPLAAQLIRGPCKGIIRAAEGASTNNYAAQCIVYVCSNDGSTLRKLLVGGQTKGGTATPPELATSLTNRKFPQSWATPGTSMIPYACVDGDRMVVELGAGQQSTATSNMQLSLGSSSSSDNAENETGTTANDPWFEFLLGLEFKSMALETQRRRARNVLLRM